MAGLPAGFKAMTKLEAIHARHHHIAQDEVGHALSRQGDALDSVFSLNRVIFLLEQAGQEKPEIGGIIHNENFRPPDRLPARCAVLCPHPAGFCKQRFRRVSRTGRIRRAFRHFPARNRRPASSTPPFSMSACLTILRGRGTGLQLFIKRNFQNKSRSLSCAARNGDLPLVQGRQFLDQSQPDARAPIAPFGRVIDLEEAVENIGLVLFRDADPAVDDRDHRCLSGGWVFRSRGLFAAQLHRNPSAGRREFKGVAEKIVDYFFELVPVEPSRQRVPVRAEDQVDLFLRGQRFKAVGDAPQQMNQVMLLQMQRYRRRFELRELEQLIDQPLQFPGVPVKHAVIFGPVLPDLAVDELLQRAFHQGQWRAELMGEIGKKP